MVQKSIPEQIARDVQALRASFRSGVTRDVKARRHQLLQLQKMLTDGTPDLIDALWKDIHKPPVEVRVSEIAQVQTELQEHLDFAEQWGKPEHVGTNLSNLPGYSYIHRDPLGVVCIIGTWNYPIQLTLQPLVGAISAGNCVLLRLPGDDTCVHTNEVMVKLLDEYIDKQFVRIVHGGVEESKAMLAEKYDLIFCTGGHFIGKIVAEAAAKTLTPTILELGGKSPSIVDETCDITISARRVAWGSFMNAGQTCVRPDYIMVSSKIGDKWVTALEKELKAFFGDNPQQSDSYGRIVNARSFARVSELLTKDTKYVTFGGQMDAKDRFIAPTLLNFKRDFAAFDGCASMAQEIFGPILPIYYYDNLDEVIDYVNDHDKPLALYIYSSNAKNRSRVLSETSSGGVVVNDNVCHLTNPSLPFGGVGGSGMGSYHGKHSYDAFSHKKAVLVKYNIGDAPQRYPPYSKKNEKILVTLVSPISNRVIKLIKYTAFAVVLAIVAALVKKNAKLLSLEK